MPLRPDYEIGNLILTQYPYGVVFGGDHGAPETTTELVQSMLADGDIVSRVRDGNRTLTLTVMVEGTDMADLASNEAALRMECSRAMNTLRFDPGDGMGAVSVFEIFPASMRLSKDDDHELHTIRLWELEIPAFPFPRSENLTVAEPMSAPLVPDPVVVDPCDSVIEWAGETGDAVGYDSTFSAVRTFDTNADWSMSLRRPAAINVDSHPYLILYWQVRTKTRLSRIDVLDSAGEPLTEAWRVFLPVIDSAPWYCSYYPVEPGQLDAGFTMRHRGVAGPVSPVTDSLAIAGVTKTNVPPGETPREQSRFIPVGGTERTPGSVHVAAPDGTSDLGLTIVHTSPNHGEGYSPPLRKWRSSGNPVSSDVTALTGEREAVNTNSVVALLPVSAVPADGYALWARMKSDTVGSFPVSASVRSFYSGEHLEPAVTVTKVASFTVADQWTMVQLGLVTLPPVPGEGELSLQFSLHRTPVAAEIVEVDDWWHFRAGDGCALTIVDVAQPNLWLESPSLALPRPAIWVGPNADKTNRRAPAYTTIHAKGTHTFRPSGDASTGGGVALFVASAGVDYAETTLSHYKRWHTNAAD